MRWQMGRSSGNIEDRRGMGPVGVGGVGVGGVVLALIGYFVFGIDPSTTTSILGGAPVEQQAGVQGAPTDEAGRFVDVVETSTADVWGPIFEEAGVRYQPPAAAPAETAPPPAPAETPTPRIEIVPPTPAGPPPTAAERPPADPDAPIATRPQPLQ